MSPCHHRAGINVSGCPHIKARPSPILTVVVARVGDRFRPGTSCSSLWQLCIASPSLRKVQSLAASAAATLFYPEETGVEGKSAPKDGKCQIDLKHACLQLCRGRRMIQLSALGPDSVRPAGCPLHRGIWLGTAQE